jgi:hypothetical protein
MGDAAGFSVDHPLVTYVVVAELSCQYSFLMHGHAAHEIEILRTICQFVIDCPFA